MKDIAYDFILLFLILALVSCSTSSTLTKVHSNPNIKIERATLGVLPFNSEKPKIGNIVSDSAASNLIGCQFKIIERSYLEKAVEERGFALANLIAKEDYRKIGLMTGVDYLLVGDVPVTPRIIYGVFRGGTYDYISGANARILDVYTGEAVVSCNYTVGTPYRKWSNPFVIGESIGKSLRKELDKQAKSKR
jgi:hypothetical protein